MSDKNLRLYHGTKKSKGCRAIRKQRYRIRPGDIVLYSGEKVPATGVHCKGTRVIAGGVSYKIDSVKVLRHIGGWNKEFVRN